MIQQSRLPRLSLAILIFCVIALLPISATSQGIVSVNKLTGTANATIPIYNVSVGDLSAPVALTYSASGLKVEDYDNSVGLGWRLIADASITREVRGFPDDVEYQGNASYSVIKGWLKSSNTAAQAIQTAGFVNANTNNCGNEITDAATIASNFSYSYDTEADYFNVSAPGLSCSFVFDANHGIKTIPYRDYQITYTTDANGIITAFTVINENGIKYYFDKPDLVSHSIDLYIPGPVTPLNDPSTLEVFKRDFQMYRANFDYAGNAAGTFVEYNAQWALTRIQDTKGNRIQYDYEYYNIANPEIYKRYSHTDIEILKPNGSGGFIKKKLYGVTKASFNLRLTSISVLSIGSDLGSYPVVQFDWQSSYGTSDDKRLINITLPRENNIFELIYTEKFIKDPSEWNGYGRYFLKGLKTQAASGLCNKVNTQFDFTYYGVDAFAHTCYCTPPINPGNSMDAFVNAQDYWGYYNGNITNPNLSPQIWTYPDNASVELYKVYPIPNTTAVIIPSLSNRNVNSNAFQGSIKSITYPTGAVTELEYENNEFFDNDVNGNVLGGGIRVKKITNNDGLNTNDITLYSYNDPANPAITTGRAISVPKFAIAFQNSTSYSTPYDKVINSTYLTTKDLNNESKDILYGAVTITKTGIGKSIYEYNTSGTFGSLPTTGWEDSKNYVARTNLSSPTPCTAIAPSFLNINNGKLNYPFTPNVNFDFERGLLKKVSHKNEAGQTVATEEYDYERSHQDPTKLYSLKLDEIGNTMVAYGKYAVNTVVDNFLVKKTSKIYNSNSTTPMEEVENYVYTPKNSSLSYRLLKEVNKQNSDLVKNITRFTYAKEYATTGTSGDPMNDAIHTFNLPANNINAIIETTQFRSESGQPEKLTGASLNTFKLFPINFSGAPLKFLPYAGYQFINQAGITNFVPSYISGGVFTKDNTNYLNAPTTIEEYTLAGHPQLVTDNSRIPKTVLSTLSYGLKVAEFSNAKPENVAFSNFEDEFTGNFSIGSGNTVQSGGRYSSSCLNFQPNTSLCRILTKSPTSNNLIISFWLKDAQGIGTIYLCNTKFGTPVCNGTPCGANPIVSFARGSQWKYYQVKIPWPFSNYTSTSFSLGTSAGVKIDDILIYPDNSGVSVYSYTTNNIGTNLLTAKTGLNGIGNTYEYDNAGRLWLVRDQFENIVEMKKYKLANRHTQQIPSINIGYNNQHYIVNQPGTFYASLPYNYESGDCNAPSIVYKWNFGDGSPEVFSNGDQNSNTSINHTYTTIGKYVVTVTASSPGMTDVVVQTPAVNSTNPEPVTVDAAPPPCFPGTPVICAAGVIQRTSAGVYILASCPPLPSNNYNTYFKLSDVTGGNLGSVYSVEWQIADLGLTNWTTQQPEMVGTGGFQTSNPFHVVHISSYQMRAKVKFCTPLGTEAYSNTITVLNGD